MATFLEDTFTDANKELSLHTGENATWVEHSLSTGEASVTNNRCRTGTVPAIYYGAPAPGSADYWAEVVFDVLTAARRNAFAIRHSTTADTCYRVMWRPADALLRLYKRVEGVETELGNTALTAEVGVSRTVRLEAVGTTIKVYVDGVEKISKTDSSITAAGRVAIHNRDENQTASAGIQIGSIKAELVGAETKSGAATVTGGGSATATGSKIGQSAPTITGGGSSVAVGAKRSQTTASASTGGSALAEGTGKRQGSASATGGGAAALSGAKGAQGAASATGGGAASASGTRTEEESASEGTGAVTGGGSATASGRKVVRTTTLISGGGALTATGQSRRRAATAITGGGATAAAGSSARRGSGLGRGGGFVVVVGSSGRITEALVTGGGAATAVGSRVQSGVAALPWHEAALSQGTTGAIEGEKTGLMVGAARRGDPRPPVRSTP